MNQAQSFADALLQGRRGQRMLLEFALASERLSGREGREDSLSAAVFLASYHLDTGKGSSAVLFGPGAAEAELTVISLKETADRLARVPLAAVSSQLMLLCLSRSVDMARYWQEPDGEDVLAGTEPMREALGRVAEHVAASTETVWWRTPVAERSQWSVQWDDDPPIEMPVEPRDVLVAAREADVAAEQEASRQRPKDPAASWSGEWWSRPSTRIPSSARELFDGSSAGLWLVEDSLGWEAATTTRLGIAPGLRVYEIDTVEAWAELCRRFPLEQTAQKRHDWYRATGRTGRWVVPDWALVAEHYDGVHLQVATYLTAAGTAILVDTDTASVIAGWNPDQTFWFTSNVRHVDEPVAWRREDEAGEVVWRRAETSGGDA